MSGQICTRAIFLRLTNFVFIGRNIELNAVPDSQIVSLASRNVNAFGEIYSFQAIHAAIRGL